jgi:membrane protein
MSYWQKVWEFIHGDLWRITLKKESFYRSLALKILRILVLSLREFGHDKCSLRASALTYYSLLSIVPLFALAFGIAKGFDADAVLKKFLNDQVDIYVSQQNVALAAVSSKVNNFTGHGVKGGPTPQDTAETSGGLVVSGGGAVTSPSLAVAVAGSSGTLPSAGAAAGPAGTPHQEQADEIIKNILNKTIEFSDKLLDQAKGGLVSGVGILLLFWVAIKVLGDIEESFNDIWGIRKSRPWMRKFSDYLAFMLVCPILFVVANSVAVYVKGLNTWSWVNALALRSLSAGLIMGLFAFTYLFMPNTQVRVSSGLLGGVVAGLLYQIVLGIYFTFQIGVSKYGAIYASFAALPLFLVWVNLSWLIVLYGAEVSFAHQNVETYEFELDCENVSRSFKRTLSLAIMHFCVMQDHQDAEPPSAKDIARHFEAPIRLVRQALNELVDARVLLEVVKDEDERSVGYHPAMPTENLTLQSVLERLDSKGVGGIPTADLATLQKIGAALQQFRETLRESPANHRILDL